MIVTSLPTIQLVGLLQHRWRMLVIGGMIVAFELVVSEPRGWLVDFRNAYYPAGYVVLHGLSLDEVILKGVAGFVNLPLIAYLFAPFAVVPLPAATLAALVLGLAASGAAYLVLANAAGLDQKARLRLLLLFAFNGPLISNLKSGNTSQVAMLGVAAVLCVIGSGRPIKAGLLLGLTALLKLPLLLLGGYFLLRRDWRGAAAFGGIIAACVLVSVFIFGPGLHQIWLNTAILQFGGGAIPAFNVQSIPAILVRWRETAPELFDWSVVSLTDTERLEVRVIQAGFLLLTLSGIWMAQIASRNPRFATSAAQMQILLLVCCALLVSPLAWSHYFCWLLLPAAFLVSRTIGFASPVAFRMGWVATLLTTPPVIFPYRLTVSMDPFYTKLLVSNYFIGGVAWLVALVLAAHELRRASLEHFPSQSAWK